MRGRRGGTSRIRAAVVLSVHVPIPFDHAKERRSHATRWPTEHGNNEPSTAMRGRLFR